MTRLPIPCLLCLFGGFFACCWATPAFGQNAKPTGRTSSLQVASSQSAARSLEQHREIQVELAWLADPLTYPHALVARVVDTNVHILGTVTDTRARDRALIIAGQQTGLHVVDHVQFLPTNRPRFTFKQPHQMTKEATQLLNSSLPARSGQIQVQVWPGGQLMLRGNVGSQTEKLAASQCFKRMPGCSCVLNRLEVMGETARIPVAARVDQARAVNRRVVKETASPAPYVMGVVVMPKAQDDAAPPPTVPTSDLARVHTLRPSLPARGAYVTDGIILLGAESSEPIPAKAEQVPPVRIEAPQPLILPKAVEVRTRHAETAVAALPRLSTISHLHARIATICNRMPHEVSLQNASPGRLIIQLKANTLTEGESLSRAIFGMPELAPYSAELVIMVTP